MFVQNLKDGFESVDIKSSNLWSSRDFVEICMMEFIKGASFL